MKSSDKADKPAPPVPCGISFRDNVLISSSQSPILTHEQDTALTNELVTLSGLSGIALPECMYGGSHVSIEFVRSGVVHKSISWKAMDSIREWGAKQGGSEGAEVGVKSKGALKWEEKGISKGLGDIKLSDEYKYDWTFSSPYIHTVTTTGVAAEAITASATATTTGSAPSAWTRLSASGIKFPLLMDQSAPILYFNDVRLYEDDLHDVGDTLASCKVRVMPSCLYVLYRNFVRVDGVMLRARDTRGECEASELRLKERLFPRKGRSQGKRVRTCDS